MPQKINMCQQCSTIITDFETKCTILISMYVITGKNYDIMY
jgi:hypothetical protein